MNDNNLIERSRKIRACYHELERSHHGSEWTVEKDALAFLTDAGLVMSQQGRWPKGGDSEKKLQHKLGECVWWLTVLADRMDLNIEQVSLDHNLAELYEVETKQLKR